MSGDGSVDVRVTDGGLDVYTIFSVVACDGRQSRLDILLLAWWPVTKGCLGVIY